MTSSGQLPRGRERILGRSSSLRLSRTTSAGGNDRPQRFIISARELLPRWRDLRVGVGDAAGHLRTTPGWRDLQRYRGGRGPAHGTTPAQAGTTSRPCRTRRTRWNHSRMAGATCGWRSTSASPRNHSRAGGNNLETDERGYVHKELLPRGRELHTDGHLCFLGRGTTPARAGTTGWPGRGRGGGWNYSRTCGNDFAEAWSDTSKDELLPHGRERRPQEPGCVVVDGTTPAGAGTTRHACLGGARSRNSRRCGNDAHHLPSRPRIMELLPRGRDLPAGDGLAPPAEGTTPALAGPTAPCPRAHRSPSNDSRTCGNDACGESWTTYLPERLPPVRERRKQRPSPLLLHRTTPARAGTTCPAGSCTSSAENDSRPCGNDSGAAPQPGAEPERLPPVRERPLPTWHSVSATARFRSPAEREVHSPEGERFPTCFIGI